jgi:energy-coupling factor transporter ATP-binding protein EcfA2
MATKPTSPPPAYFLSLSLENVRSFGEKQTISFAREDGGPAQWTIILGDNGVGKTTVLKSLALIRPAPTSLPIEDYEIIYEPVFFSGQNKGKFLSRGLIESFGEIEVEAKFATGIISDSQFIDYGPYPPLILQFQIDSNGRYVGGGTGIYSERESGLIVYAYGAGRTTGNSTLSEMPDSADTCASLFDDRADLLNPEEWFLQMEYSSLKQDKQAAKALEQVRQVLLKVLPDITDIRISSKGHQQYLELASPYGWVRLRDMSLGYQTLVVWLTDFASKLFSRYPDSPNPLEEPAIVLIDEIDLHLHPSWQRKLIGFLSDIFRNTQFIATAHSPLVVQAAGDEGANVVLLRREGDQTVVVTDVEDVRGWRVDQILTSSFFNLETARSLETEKKLARQAKLLNKIKLTAEERQELEALTQELEGQPMGSTRPHAEEEEAELLRQIIERLGTSSPNLSAGQ